MFPSRLYGGQRKRKYIVTSCAWAASARNKTAVNDTPLSAVAFLNSGMYDSGVSTTSILSQKLCISVEVWGG